VDINYELLRTFVEAGSAATFASAAARRHVTPSAVSQQIRTLETQLGLALFQRLGRRARLTDGGRALLASLQGHLGAVEQALAEARAEPGVIRGSLRIGAPGPFARVWLRPRLVALMRAYPELTIDVSFDVPSVLARELVAGHYDVCILASDPGHPALDLAPLHVEEFVAVASKDYLRGTPPRPRTAAEFRRNRFLVFDRDEAMHSPWWRASFGRREPLPERIAARVASLDELAALCEAGLGITVLPTYFVAAAVKAGRLVALPAPRTARAPRNQIYLAWRRGTPPTARFTAVKAALSAPSVRSAG
jgi:DNA-binding transcriptional LysR family regulator